MNDFIYITKTPSLSSQGSETAESEAIRSDGAPHEEKVPEPSVNSGSFEINLGLITLTNFDLSNPNHTRFLFAVIVTFVIAKVYKFYIKNYANYFAHASKKGTDQSFLYIVKMMEDLEEGEALVIEIAESLIDRLRNHEKIKRLKTLKSQQKQLYGLLQRFETEFGEVVEPSLLTSTKRLGSLVEADAIDIESIIAMLDEVCAAVEAIALPTSTRHLLKSITFQVKQMRQDKNQ